MKASAAGKVLVAGPTKFMKKSGRKRNAQASTNVASSHGLQRTRIQFIVIAVKASMASVEATTTSSVSHHEPTSISSSAGLKIQMKGRITVRSA